MNSILKEIVRTIEASSDTPGYLDIVFGDSKLEVLQGYPVVIFGSGSLGQEVQSTLALHGVQASAFCDNDKNKSGHIINGLPVISFNDLLGKYQNSIIFVAVLKHRAAIVQQLIEAGFSKDHIVGTSELSDFIYMYSMFGTQILFTNYAEELRGEKYLDFLFRNQERIARAQDLFEDSKSKSLMINKLALMGTNRSFMLFKQFISQFSEPYRDFGLSGYVGTPEDYYYFNNDLIKLTDGEIYVDIGAYDGDTVETFSDACHRQGIRYEHIFAFEPDPPYYERLCQTTSAHKDVSCYPIGLWSETGKLRFVTSDISKQDQTAAICASGNAEIQVVSLDDFLKGGNVTLIKADPGGNIIPHVLQGATCTVRKFKPKLALGAYHGVGTIFEIPLMVTELHQGYRMALRHNTCHLCDTDLYAV